MVRMFFNPGWHRPEFLALSEAYDIGADVGICLNPHSYRPWMKEVAKTSGLPLMIDNGAYQSWRTGEEPLWAKAVEIAEDLEVDFIVCLDKIGDPEESLRLSLEHFGDTHIEKIVPFHAATTRDPDLTRRHLKLLLDNNVRVFGFPSPAASSKKNLLSLFNQRWLVPRRAHILGAPVNNKTIMTKFKFFHTLDVGLRSLMWEGGSVSELAEKILGIQNTIYDNKQTRLTHYDDTDVA